MDLAAAVRSAAKPAILMLILAISCEIIASYIWIFGVAAFALEAAFILVSGWHAARRGSADAISAGVAGAILGLVCAIAGNAARWAMILLLPTRFVPALADAAPRILADTGGGMAFWAAAGFVLGAAGAAFTSTTRGTRRPAS
ncbi:hypothetical protein L0Y65_04250 [Candidatus Micrarchaeota archaeon]|nr:hypothetical protein [Candidatus Micrarchaeota archaeon]